MANNEIRIPGYERFLEEGKVMLDNEIKKYESQGFKIREEKEDSIKMSKVVLISPIKDVNVQRVTFTPNPDYNFDFYIEAREYASDERNNPLSFKTAYESFIAKLDSSEITPAEKKDVESSVSYQLLFGGKAPGDNE
jgi:hypothetical protein